MNYSLSETQSFYHFSDDAGLTGKISYENITINRFLAKAIGFPSAYVFSELIGIANNSFFNCKIIDGKKFFSISYSNLIEIIEFVPPGVVTDCLMKLQKNGIIEKKEEPMYNDNHLYFCININKVNQLCFKQTGQDSRKRNVLLLEEKPYIDLEVLLG